MEKPTKIQDKTYPTSLKVEVENFGWKDYNQEVLICCLLDAKVILTGTVTGKRYEFTRAGTAVPVDIRDKDEILNKKRGRACCGGQSGKVIFQLV